MAYRWEWKDRCPQWDENPFAVLFTFPTIAIMFYQIDRWPDRSLWIDLLIAIIPGLLLSLILIPLTLEGVNLINNVGANAKALSVHLIHGGDTAIPEPIPAAEILVRGSQEPSDQQSDRLLRAARGQPTATEELLRVPEDNGAH